MNYEPWIWTELLAFDNTQSDLGVKEFLDKTGFIPAVICLMSSTPDIVLQHQPLTEELTLSPAICSRDGHGGNEERRRQEWTNFQLKNLVDCLHSAGVEVYLSLFTVFYQNKHHHEWMSDHPEALQEWDFQGKGLNINVTRRFKDGSYIEDYFIDQTVKTVVDYGFDGWHGPDGYGPLTSGTIAYTDCADDVMGQFADSLQRKLPECITCSSGGNTDILQARMKWIWANLRMEWIQFNAKRWETFWRKMTDAMHKINRKTAINSAWTKAPFESLYRYGIDYKRIAAAGVDAMIVETVAANLQLGVNDRDRHFEFLAMLMQIKAYAPNMKLIFLHGVKDIVEQYDLIHHSPTSLERENYSLANMFVQDSDGSLKRCADGFLVCLGDGIKQEEWSWLKKHWDLGFSARPESNCGLTVVWTDSALIKSVESYIATGMPDHHRLVYPLMENGVQIQAYVRIEDINASSGPLLVLNPQLLDKKELSMILKHKSSPVIMLGGRCDELPEADIFIEDAPAEDSLVCCIYNVAHETSLTVNPEMKSFAAYCESPVPLRFVEDINYHEFTSKFMQICAEKIAAKVNSIAITNTGADVKASVQILETVVADGVSHIAVSNSSLIYSKCGVDLKRRIESVKILSDFPIADIEPSGSTFNIKVPGKGIVVLEVTCIK